MTKTLQIRFDENRVRSAVPDELKRIPRWLVWRWVDRDGKPTKIPVDAKTLGAGKSNDMTTWADFETAVKACVSHSELAGIGFVFNKADDIVGVDLDDVVDAATHAIKSWALTVIQTLDTYAEFSPSGTGVKMLGRGKIKIAHPKPKEGTEHAEDFEIYNDGRFFTITGERLPSNSAGIEKRTEQFKLVYDQFIGRTWGKEPSKKKEEAGAAKMMAAVAPGTELAKIQSALAVVPADDYRVWLEIGFALHWWESQGDEGKQSARRVFDEWSKKSPKFDESGQDKHWDRAKAEGNNNGTITLGTLYRHAEANGWTPPETGGLPSFRLPGENYPIKSAATELARLVRATNSMFGRGNAVVRLGRDDNGSPILTPVSTAAFRSEIERVAAPYYVTEEGAMPAVANEGVARALKESEYFLAGINHIKTITRCPVLIDNGNGTVNQVHAYSARHETLASGEECKPMSLETAVAFIKELFLDTNFVSEGDRSRAIANLLTPAMVFGEILNARAPIFLNEANDSQAGKGFLHKIIAAIYNSDVAVANQRDGVGSLGESFNKHLIEGANFISLDNLRGRVDCPEVESFLTEDRYHARALRVDMTIDPKKFIVMMTSNRADVQKDLANRASIVRILKQPPSHVYRTFNGGDLLDHVRDCQSMYLGAVFSVVKDWVKQGKPKTTEGRHDFRKWAQPLDWIVQNFFKAAPLMDGSEEAKLRITTPHFNWLRDVALVVAREASSEWLRTAKIIDLLSMDGTVEIPGLEDGKSLDDSETAKACQQQFGRRMTKVFGSAMELPIDRLMVSRQKGAWNDGHQAWEYRVVNREDLKPTRPDATPDDRLMPVSDGLFDNPAQNQGVTENPMPEVPVTPDTSGIVLYSTSSSSTEQNNSISVSRTSIWQSSGGSGGIGDQDSPDPWLEDVSPFQASSRQFIDSMVAERLAKEGTSKSLPPLFDD